MIEVQTLALLREQIAQAGQRGRIAFVPTMGNLHTGHLRLVREAKRQAQTVVVSIFVNPLQFGPQEDLASYPRTLEQDLAALRDQETDLVFVPQDKEIYPQGMQAHTRVEVPHLSDLHCGTARPGHFVGVATVVCKLFNMVQPNVAIFGNKDYQQVQVIRRMVEDLAMPIEIIGMPTVRESDGLALSSRNRYLNTEQRAQAPLLYAELQRIAAALREGSSDFAGLQDTALDSLRRSGFVPDYVRIVDARNLEPASADAVHLVVLAAARLGQARLIDNIEIDRIQPAC